MAGNCSFKEYIKDAFENQFWELAEEYLRENFNPLDIKLYKVHRAGEPEVTDVQVEHVWIEDLPEMKIQFDVALSVVFEIPEADYHYDESEEKGMWLMVRCHGDISNNLQDFKVFEVSDYSGKNRTKNPLDDSLVPYIPYEKLDEVATSFLEEYYPGALRITQGKENSVWVDPKILTERLGLTLRAQRIREDVLHICLPHYLHAPVAIYALDNKVHVMTEKPMSIGFKDAQDMVDAAIRAERP